MNPITRIAIGSLCIVITLVAIDLTLATWISGIICLIVTTLKAFRVGQDEYWYLIGGLFYIPVFVEAYMVGQINHAISNIFYAILSLVAFYTRARASVKKSE